MREAVQQYGIEALTRREQEILRLWPSLGRNSLLAEHLGIRQQTVKNHISSILAKLRTHSIGQAAIQFDRHERGVGATWPEIDRRRGERRRRDRRRTA